jgi:uncharacterized membrane protein
MAFAHSASRTWGSRSSSYRNGGTRSSSFTSQRSAEVSGTVSTSDDWLTRGLGWASAGRGVPLLLAPGWSARVIGVGDAPRNRAAAAVVGVRELAAAAGLLLSESPVWLWARVAGDVMDLGMLSRALINQQRQQQMADARLRQLRPVADWLGRQWTAAGRLSQQWTAAGRLSQQWTAAGRLPRWLGQPGTREFRRGQQQTLAALAAGTGILGLDLYAAVTRSRQKTELELTATTTVASTTQEAYDLWRRLEILPSFMAHLDEVRTTGEGTSHWRASAPFGMAVEWDAEITDDVPGERIAWRSVDGATVGNEGEVRFLPAPGGRGSEVHVRMRYSMPAGPLGAAVARYFGEEPHQQLDDDLRRFKQVVETGEVVRSEGAPGGKRARREFPQHPARPLSQKELEEIQT